MTQVTRPVPRAVAIAAIALLAVGAAFAKKQFAMPQVQPAATYAAHEAHTDESVTVAAEPYESAPKSDIFAIKWADHDLLPILVVITNDGDQPITVGNLQIQLITADHEKIPPATNDDLYRRLSNPKDPQRKIPIPLPTGRAKSSVNHDQLDEMDRAQFAARVVEPHTTRAGFFFFDIRDVNRPLPGARLDISGLKNSHGQELFYFDLPMDKYLGRAQ